MARSRLDQWGNAYDPIDATRDLLYKLEQEEPSPKRELAIELLRQALARTGRIDPDD